MAEVLKDFVFPRRGRTSKYAQYLDGQIWKVRVDEVGATDARLLQAVLYDTAKRRRRKVRTKAVDDGAAVVVQAYTPE